MNHRIRYRVEYAGFRLFIFLVRISPLFLKRFFGLFARGVFALAGKKYKRLVISNLRTAFPGLSDAEIASLKGKVLNHFTSIFIEIIYLFGGKDPDKVIGNIRVKGEDHIKRVLSMERGAILFSAHFGNWELIPFILSRKLGFRLSSIARRMDNPLTEKIVRDFRAFMGSEMIYKEGSLRKILRVTEENGLVYLLIDQNTIRREGVPVRFFGKEVIAVTTVSQLVLKKNIPAIPLFITYEGGEIILNIGEKIEWDGTGDPRKDLSGLTQRCMAIIEDMIRRYPDHWFWFHDRWKPRKPLKKEEKE